MLSALVPASVPSPLPPFGDRAAALRPLVRAVVAAVLRENVRHPDVDDCTNEALRRALEGQDRLRSGDPLRPWVVGIARHVALDALRARKRGRLAIVLAPRGDDSSDDVAAVDRVPDSKPSPFDRVADARRDRDVREAIDTLPGPTRTALVLFHLEGKSYQEIATQMKVPLGTVATWVTRGRRAIAERIEIERPE